MKSPQDMRIIQIDITNACIHTCSNCTRFCGHHKKPFFMDWETFRRAVNSLKGYKGTVGIMGGEPTLHPQFERFVRYIEEHPYFPKGENLLVKPTKEFMKVLGRMEQRDTRTLEEHGVKKTLVYGWGLWSALSAKYKEHYELIQDTFNMQAVNDHKNIMYHSPILLTRREMGITDEEWRNIRDNCWAQDAWSATITPKGAFFCEIAGALDMLFDGPGGWPIEPGWWKRTPDQFGEQLNWCELCGIAINTFTRDANDEMDDMSPWYYEKLKKLGSPKVRKQGMANVLAIKEDGTIDEKSMRDVKEVRHSVYYDSWFSRFSSGNDWLNPIGFTGAFIIDSKVEATCTLEIIKHSSEHMDSIIAGTGSQEVFDYLVEELEGFDKVNVVLSERTVWGTVLNKILTNCNPDYFVLLLNNQSMLSKGCSGFLKQYVLNPGSILIGTDKEEMEAELGKGILALFSPRAYAIKRAGYDHIAAVNELNQFIKLWDDNKVLPMEQQTFADSSYQIEPGVRYALYGAGATADYLYGQFDKEQIRYITDSDCEKWGKDFHGHSIISPEELFEKRRDFDKVFIASNYFFEIKTKLLQIGFDEEQIVSTLVVI